MDNGTRRTRFETRIALEREFLAPVNAAFGHIAPLAGMTQGAIDSWQRRVTESTPPVVINSIAQILREAALRGELLADNSKEVFEPDHRPAPDSIKELRLLLDRTLTSVRY